MRRERWRDARCALRGALAAASAITALTAGCAKPLPDPGESLYRAGDLRGAVDAWRASGNPALAPRIASVEAELDARADGYVESARALESEGRLAESMLDYRLSLTLRPDDAETLDHVQVLARQMVSQRAQLLDSYREVRAKGDLVGAKNALETLRRLDPFEPAYETEERRLAAAIDEQWRIRRARAREARAAQVESLVEAGRAAFGEEKLETALDLWRRALLIDPDNERLQAYIASAERQLQTLEQLRAHPAEDG